MGCILNWITHNSAAGNDGNALITKFRTVALGLCCTSESFGNKDSKCQGHIPHHLNQKLQGPRNCKEASALFQTTH